MTSRPELIKARTASDGNGKTFNGYLSFPTKPMPHSLLLQFKGYDYQKYVASIEKYTNKEGKQDVRESNNLGFVPTISEYNLSGASSGNQPEISKSSAIELPFPRQLTDSQGIRVAQFERDFLYERLASGIASMEGQGGLGNVIKEISTSAEQMLDGVMGYAQSVGKSINEDGVKTALLNALTTAGTSISNFDASKATALAGYLARNYISGEVAKSISVIGERAVNPQETLSFTGVDLRRFTFNWDLYPSNIDDSNMIRNIVRLLKQKSLPTTESADGSGATARAFLNYPDIVELNLLGVDEEHFMRFKRCMIGNITVDYGAGGMPEIIKGGKPAAVNLSIEFSELQINTAQDYGAPDPKPETEAQASTGAPPSSGARGFR